MFVLENEILKVTIKLRGAELDSIHNKQNKVDYLWSGDPAVWGKKSPVLFPIVGSLKNDTGFYKGKSLNMTRHGFAREMEFLITEESGDRLALTMESTEDTMWKYPFHFRFEVIYTLQGDTLKVTYAVHNTGDEAMPFSVGAHPAFALPLQPGSVYNDYYLEFNKVENAERWPIAENGLMETSSVPMLNNTNHLPLTKKLFEKDAIVFKDLVSNKVVLKSDSSSAGLEMTFTGFPYMGIWAAKNADFVCIEPWIGISDSTDSDQQLENKEGMNILMPANTFDCSWLVTMF